MISRTDIIFNKSEYLLELLPEVPERVKDLIEFLDGFGMKYSYDSECDIIAVFNKHIMIDIYYYMGEDMVITMNCVGEWGCPFTLSPPSSKRHYKSLMSYIFLLEWMHKNNVSYSSLSSPVYEYGCTFDTKEIYKNSRKKPTKCLYSGKMVKNKVKNKPLYRENWF